MSHTQSSVAFPNRDYHLNWANQDGSSRRALSNVDLRGADAHLREWAPDSEPEEGWTEWLAHLTVGQPLEVEAAEGTRVRVIRQADLPHHTS